ncbi:MAG: hypothetical protein AABZ23_00645 [Deltaproteobacteria bacterium]
MGIFIVIGAIALIAGLSFLAAPQMMKRLSETSARIVTSIDSTALSYRTGLGISLIIASLLFFFVAYYIRIKG